MILVLTFLFSRDLTTRDKKKPRALPHFHEDPVEKLGTGGLLIILEIEEEE